MLDGVFDLDGELPVNPDGGLKSFGHPIGASGLRMLFECWLQFRGEAGERQIASGSRPQAGSHPQPRWRAGRVRLVRRRRRLGAQCLMATKILFSPKFPKPVFDIAVEMTPPGFELVPVDSMGPQFLDAAKDAEYFMGFGRNPLSHDFYAAGKNIKLVQLISAGYNTLDLEAARKAKVPIANNGGANSVAVAEHAVMLILATMKKLAWQHKNCVDGKWRVGDFAENRFYELEGKTVGIVGLGNIGKKVARRLHGFDVNIIYYDILRLPEHEEDALGVRFVLLDELLKRSDVVTLHVPLSPQTKDMISERQLGLMKPTAILVNTCRGPVVDEMALHKALITKKIAGAGLDVMVDEPPSKDNPLLNVENITITPHTAGPTWENWAKAFRNAFDNILRVHAGRKPMWVVPELRSLVQ